MTTISGSVGSGGTNNKADVVTVQKLLNSISRRRASAARRRRHHGPRHDPDDPGLSGDVVGVANPDGKIDPGRKTWKALDSGQGFASPLSGAEQHGSRRSRQAVRR